jgi:flagellar motor switch protein FliG
MNDTSIHFQDTGIRKAAILVACLEPEAADAMLQQIPAEQALQVREAAAMLGDIDPDEQRRIIDEFLRVDAMVPDQSPPGIELDDPRTDPRTASPSFTGRRNDQPTEPRSQSERFSEAKRSELPGFAVKSKKSVEGEFREPTFQFLNEAEDDKLSSLLQSERPQTVALVLSHLPANRAGGVLSHFPPNLQVEILRRLADLEETDPAVLYEVEQALEMRLSKQFAMQQRRVAGLEAISGILEACDDSTSGRILENLAACDRSLAEKLGLQTVAFDDLGSLDAGVLAGIFRAADPILVQTSLIGAEPALAERVLATMPPRDAKRLRKQINHPGPLRLSDIEDARRQIASLAQRMLKNKKKSAFAA